MRDFFHVGDNRDICTNQQLDIREQINEITGKDSIEVMKKSTVSGYCFKMDD
ncbi:hypothetical protein TNIN_278231, partial [Trichonephila inaurata madagascariensis]